MPQMAVVELVIFAKIAQANTPLTIIVVVASMPSMVTAHIMEHIITRQHAMMVTNYVLKRKWCNLIVPLLPKAIVTVCLSVMALAHGQKKMNVKI